MDNFEDYYETLQVHHMAEPEVIEAAYKKLAQKYHPDVNKSPAAMEKMKRINEAHDILSNSLSRKDYDTQRSRGKGTATKPREPAGNVKPRPVLKVLPKHIRFKDLDYTQSKTTHFDIENVGGPFTGYGVGTDRLPEWLEITGIEKLGHLALPARVHIKAWGQRVGNQYDCYIPVRIENAESHYSDETQVHIEVALKGPVLEMDTRCLEFNVFTDVIPRPQSVRLVNMGVGCIEGDLIPRQKWIKISPRHVCFDHQEEVQVQIDTGRLVNNMLGYIDVKTNCASDIITVKATLVEEKKKKGK
jgi:hypothetical protein